MKQDTPISGVVRMVAAGFTALFVSFGIAYSFGVFLPAIALEFRAGAGQTAGLFSATAFVFFCLGALTGPWAERHGLRPLLVAAALLLALGLFGSSWAPSLLAAYLTYGVGTEQSRCRFQQRPPGSLRLDHRYIQPHQQRLVPA